MASNKELDAAVKANRRIARAKVKQAALDKEEKDAVSLAAITASTLKAEPPTPKPEKKKTKAQLLEEESKEERDAVAKEARKDIYNKDKNKWDVPLGTEILVFDPELSYELTGYRPITMTKGLDFKKEDFQQLAITYETTGSYSTFLMGSKAYDDFWRQQYKYCREGITIGRFTLTGDNYFFINFYRLPNTRNVGKAGSGREETFPDFLAKQYEYFHYIELCERLGFDIGALKSRGIGFSEIAASLGVKTYTVVKQSRCMYTASSDKFIADVLEKAWLQLEFLNAETQGAFKRIRMKKDTDLKKKASVVDRDGAESGHLAIIEGRVADNPRKLRGGRVERLFFEESGSNPILVTAYNQSEALVTIMGKRIGSRFVWGKNKKIF